MKKLVIVSLLFSVCLVFSMQTGLTKQLSSPHFTMKFDKSIPDDVILQIKDSMEQKFLRLQSQIKVTASRKIAVRLVTNSARFKIEAKTSLFINGDINENTIILAVELLRDDIEQFNNLLSRVIVTAITKQINGCPKWLGVAYGLYVGNAIERFNQNSKAQYYAFSDIDEVFDRASGEQELKESYSVLAKTIQFFVSRYGERRVLALFPLLNKDVTLEKALAQSFGESIERIQQDWQLTLSSKQK